MLGDPILRLVFEFFGVLGGSFCGWCSTVSIPISGHLVPHRWRTAILLVYFATMRPVYPHADEWFPFLHWFALPVLLAPLFGGYYFNKYVIHIHE